MLIKKNWRVSISIRTKHIKIRYCFIQDQIEKGDIGLEYCHTDKMVANIMTKPLQGEKFPDFRDRIMGMSNSEDIARVQKVRDESA